MGHQPTVNAGPTKMALLTQGLAEAKKRSPKAQLDEQVGGGDTNQIQHSLQVELA